MTHTHPYIDRPFLDKVSLDLISSLLYMAGLIVKQFIEKNWNSVAENYDGFEPAPEVHLRHYPPSFNVDSG